MCRLVSRLFSGVVCSTCVKKCTGVHARAEGRTCRVGSLRVVVVWFALKKLRVQCCNGEEAFVVLPEHFVVKKKIWMRLNRILSLCPWWRERETTGPIPVGWVGPSWPLLFWKKNSNRLYSFFPVKTHSSDRFLLLYCLKGGPEDAWFPAFYSVNFTRYVGPILCLIVFLFGYLFFLRITWIFPL